MLLCSWEGDIMHERQLCKILATIARKNNTYAENVRREMLLAMKIGQNSKDPAVQAVWESIPRKGAELTLEEFLDYLLKQTLQ